MVLYWAGAMLQFCHTAMHRRRARRIACAVFLVAALWLPGLGPAGGRPLWAQLGEKQLGADVTLFGHYLTELFTQIGGTTRGEVSSFINFSSRAPSSRPLSTPSTC